jgi:uncharacterized protein (DUF952 family)
MTILHICTEAAWQSAQEAGSYRAASLDTEGFIHCSTPAQVVGSANRYYAGQSDVVLLSIDAHNLTSELKYERANNGDTFPHIYGPLNTDAVTQVVPFPCNADGTFTLPQCFE